MADKTINELVSATPLAGTEELPVWQSGATKKVTAQDIADLASGGGGLAPEDLIQSNVLYVSKDGNDSNDGSLSQPLLTIQAAADLIGSAANSTEFNDPALRFYKVKVGPGVYTGDVTFGTRPHIVLDLSSALIVGNVTQQYDQGGTFGGTFQATKLSIVGSDLRSYTTSVNPRLGVEGEVILESIGSGSSLFMVLSLINTGVSSNIRKRLGSGGGIFTGQVFIESTNVGGSIINASGSGSTTLYAANADTSSTQAIGGVSGAVNLNVIRNVRFNGPVVVNSAHGRWFNVEFKAAQAHDFTGSSGAISVDANSAESYLANVPTKGSETLNLLDTARGVKADHTAVNYSASSNDLKAHLAGLDTALASKMQRNPLQQTTYFEFWVSKFGNDSNPGSFDQPKLTIQGAINAYPDGAGGCVIRVSPGTYTGDITVTSKLNVFIQGHGVTDSHPVAIFGQINLSASCTRFRMKDIQHNYNAANSNPNLVINGSEGRHYFENVTFVRTAPATGTDVVEFVGNYQRWTDFIQCTLAGTVKCGGTPLSNASLSFKRCDMQGASGYNQILMDHANYVVALRDCVRVGPIAHNAGILALDDIASVTPDGSGNFINSSATSTPATNRLFMSSLNLLLVNGTFAKINKTGDCPYTLFNCHRSISSDTLIGAKLVQGDNARDVLANVPSPANYTPASTQVDGHLTGIDEAFLLRARRVSPPASSTDTGTLGDYAVDASFAYFCIGTDTWVRTPVVTW